VFRITKILMLLAHNDIDTDPRVSKAYCAAITNGYSIKVCCYMQYNESTYSETIDRIRMIFSNNVHVYKKSKQLHIDKKHTSISLMELLSKIIMLSIHPVDIFFKSKYFKPDIVHANDLNTLLAGVMYKKIYGSKLIYDSHEVWVDTLCAYPLIVIKIVSAYENFLIKYADEVITVNNLISDELSERYNIPKPHVVMNVPSLQQVKQPEHGDVKVIYQGKYNVGRNL